MKFSAVTNVAVKAMCEYCGRECSNAFHIVVFRFNVGIIRAFIFYFECCSLHTVTYNTVHCDTEMKEAIAWTSNG